LAASVIRAFGFWKCD